MAGYFHVSPVPLSRPISATWLALSPTLPTSTDSDAADIPRLCLSPTPAQCFVALGFTTVISPWYWVYQSHPDTDLVFPTGVHDTEATGERWSLQDTNVKLVACVPRASFDPNVLLPHWDENRPVEEGDMEMVFLNPYWRGRPDTVPNQKKECRHVAAFWVRYQRRFETFAQEAIRDGRLPA